MKISDQPARASSLVQFLSPQKKSVLQRWMQCSHAPIINTFYTVDAIGQSRKENGRHNAAKKGG